MIVGITKLCVFIPTANNLKEKRMVLRSLKNRLRSNFNISITEIDGRDKWQSSTLALAAVGRDKSGVNSLISNIIDYLERNKQIQLLDYEMELI